MARMLHLYSWSEEIYVWMVVGRPFGARPQVQGKVRETEVKSSTMVLGGQRTFVPYSEQ